MSQEGEGDKQYGDCEGPGSEYLKMISSDKHEFIVKRKVAMKSFPIQDLLQVTGNTLSNETEVINFRQVPSHVLSSYLVISMVDLYSNEI